MPSLLIVDDDQALAEHLKLKLHGLFHNIKIALQAEIAIKMFPTYKPDLLLMDVMLGTLDGYSLCKRFKAINDTPIIIYTSLNSVEDELFAFEAGADYFISKPVNIDLLKAKIQNLIFQLKNKEKQPIFKFGKWIFNSNLNSLSYENSYEVSLTFKIARLLRIFLTHPQQLLSRAQLVSLIYEHNADLTDRAIDTLIYRLRKYLNVKSTIIETVRNEGYILNAKVLKCYA